MTLPKIIQGGMGVYISNPFLAKEVSLNGGLGTVSGVAPDRIMALILQSGDPDGHYRRALSHFPFQDKVEMVMKAYFIEGGASRGQSRTGIQVYSVNPSELLISLIVCANFAFVWLAKEGHDNPISINYLEKINIPIIYAITGAMLAWVDVISMGAGIPIHVPQVITNLIEGKPLKYPIPVVGEKEMHWMEFNPEKFFGSRLPPMKKPLFLPIISSMTLALVFAKIEKKMPGSVYGFVVEESTAGGHNAKPRNGAINADGEYIYDERDRVDYGKLAELGFPFWIGGSYASPEKLNLALSLGASGIQVGTIFALCGKIKRNLKDGSETIQVGASGMDPDLRTWVRRRAYLGQLKVLTSSTASPTGYAFKVAVVNGTASSKLHYNARQRVCSQGALRVLYRKPNGQIGYRCPAEPITDYLRKGGNFNDTEGVCCICNGLLATAGLVNELPIVTLGDDVSFLHNLMADENSSYNAKDVLAYLSVTKDILCECNAS